MIDEISTEELIAELDRGDVVGGMIVDRLRELERKLTENMQNRPVAFRVKAGDGWVLFGDKNDARAFAERMGVDYQGLYARLGNTEGSDEL